MVCDLRQRLNAASSDVDSNPDWTSGFFWSRLNQSESRDRQCSYQLAKGSASCNGYVHANPDTSQRVSNIYKFLRRRISHCLFVLVEIRSFSSWHLRCMGLSLADKPGRWADLHTSFAPRLCNSWKMQTRLNVRYQASLGSQPPCRCPGGQILIPTYSSLRCDAPLQQRCHSASALATSLPWVI